MKPDIYHVLEHNIDLALSAGYVMNQYFSLTDVEGHYMPASEEQLSCHPLETLVLGQEIQNCINLEIAENLGVTPHWIDGFLDGYGDSGLDKAYIELHKGDRARIQYLEGFEDGQEVQDWIINLEASFNPQW